MKTDITIPRIITGLILTAAGMATSAHAALVTQPPGLNPGDTYQLIFITNGTILGTSPDLSTYDDFVNAEAAQNELLPTTTWHAVVATANQQSASTNAPDAEGAGVYLLNGMTIRLPTGPSIYSASLNHSNYINVDQFGDVVGTSRPWTGSGSGQGHFLGNTNTFLANRGSTVNTDVNWIGFQYVTDTNDLQRVFALSDVFTVPVPEPSSALFGLFGAACFLLKRRKD